MLIAGIDIGGTSIRGALFERGESSSALRIVRIAKRPTPPLGHLQQMRATLRELVSELQLPSNVSVGVGIPGVFDRANGIMQTSLNLRMLQGVQLHELFRQALGREHRVVIESDVNCAGRAQYDASPRQSARYVYLSIGTGVGGCVILDNAIVTHTRGGPGHLGHIIVDSSASAPACACGTRGCLEALVRRGGVDDLTIAEAIALGCLQIAHLYAPDGISLGGGVIDAKQGLVERVAERFESVRSRLCANTQITRAPLSSDLAGVTGAALLTLNTTE